MEENRKNEETNEVNETVEKNNDGAVTAECEKESKGDKKKFRKLEAEINELKAEIAKKDSEKKEADDKYIRMLAEYDNFRRRSAKEREGIYSDACADTIVNILPVLDNLERATAFSDSEKVAEGLSMILKSFTDIMAKMNVKEIESLGKKFDPNFHNAVMHIEDDSFGEEEIVEVLQKGYLLGDKVIRYAMVKVAN